MHKLTLPFIGQELEIYIATSVKPAKLLELEDTLVTRIEALRHKLGVDMENSQLMHLNDSDLNYPVEVTPELWEYFQLNLETAKRSLGTILPFQLGTKKAELADLATAYELFPQEHVIMRKQEIRFNPATLCAPYMMSQLAIALEKLGVDNYLMNYHNYYFTRGGDNWEAKLEHPDSGDTLEMVVRNEAMYMQLHMSKTTPEPVQAYNPFKAIDDRLTFIAVIVESSDLLTAKIVANLTESFTHEKEFSQMANEWKCGLTVLAANGEIKQYSPDKI